MRICLLTEGSYPYVVGGVSSWCQMLIQGLPEHEFFIYSIGNIHEFFFLLFDVIIQSINFSL